MSRESVPCGCQQPPKSTANLSVAIILAAPSLGGNLAFRRNRDGNPEQVCDNPDYTVPDYTIPTAKKHAAGRIEHGPPQAPGCRGGALA